MRTYRVAHLFLVAALVAAPIAAGAQAPAPTDRTIASVVLRPGVTVDLHLRERANPRVHGRTTIVAVHGFAHNATTWDALAERVMTGPIGASIGRFVAVDLPGHGASGLPVGITYGELLIEDYATALGAALDSLGGQGRIAVVGHSMGGLVIQVLQERLLQQGESLRSRYGVRAAALLASALPHELPWAFSDSGAASGILSQLVEVDAQRGVVVNVPAVLGPQLFFSDTSGAIVAGAPTPDDVAAMNLLSPEAFYAGAELIGAGGFSRPSVQGGAFSLGRGTPLFVIGFSEDALFGIAEERALAAHLTGQQDPQTFIPITDPTAVHDCFVSDAILDGLTGAFGMLFAAMN